MEGLGTGVDAGGCLPAKVEAEPVTCLAIRQAFVGLQEHHGRHHAAGWSDVLSRVRMQIGEVVISEHLVARDLRGGGKSSPASADHPGDSSGSRSVVGSVRSRSASTNSVSWAGDLGDPLATTSANS